MKTSCRCCSSTRTLLGPTRLGKASLPLRRRCTRCPNAALEVGSRSGASSCKGSVRTVCWIRQAPSSRQWFQQPWALPLRRRRRLPLGSPGVLLASCRRPSCLRRLPAALASGHSSASSRGWRRPGLAWPRDNACGLRCHPREAGGPRRQGGVPGAVGATALLGGCEGAGSSLDVTGIGRGRASGAPCAGLFPSEVSLVKLNLECIGNLGAVNFPGNRVTTEGACRTILYASTSPPPAHKSLCTYHTAIRAISAVCADKADGGDMCAKISVHVSVRYQMAQTRQTAEASQRGQPDRDPRVRAAP